MMDTQEDHLSYMMDTQEDHLFHKIIQLDSWDRKDQYLFFKDFDNPHFSITSFIEVTSLYNYTKQIGSSFFASYLFAAQQTTNSIPEFKMRVLEDDRIVEYKYVSTSSAILKENNIFTFCNFSYFPQFPDFLKHFSKMVHEHKKKDTPLSIKDCSLNQIHYSVIPWITQTSLTNPRMKWKAKDTIPKIVFGKYQNQNEHLMLPITIEVNHSLIDGYHAGLFYTEFQRLVDDPETLLQ